MPGRCIRFQESLEQSIQRCAELELGCRVRHTLEPIKVYEFTRNWPIDRIGGPDERSHFISLVYACKTPADYDLELYNKPSGAAGHLEWFDRPPDELTPVHSCYAWDWDQLLERIHGEDY